MQTSLLNRFLSLLILLASMPALAGAMPPQLDERGRAGYQDYLKAGKHRAFAINDTHRKSEVFVERNSRDIHETTPL